MDCWDYKKCAETVRDECPAYPDHGLNCWKVTGTNCGLGQMKMKSLAEKIEYCRGCDFYIEYANKF